MCVITGLGRSREAEVLLQQSGSVLGAAALYASPVHGELAFYSTLAQAQRQHLSPEMLTELQQVGVQLLWQALDSCMTMSYCASMQHPKRRRRCLVHAACSILP